MGKTTSKHNERIIHLISSVLEKDELLYYFPQCFYVVYDTEHTVWFFSFASWDGQIRPILTVGVFAADGSIFGIKCSKADG